ncbi:class I SAM-dependent methyltransferase [Actinocrinis puniceicyclus]|uniref:Class I SAM-dependent methyltransferase n=1 Tax=Actinocrinis puniceicyclus TaxID=977794 RepID=A0A8J7WP81_9ACTN|nr:class I SAM-dependent methyltransferase [Actinocrinis puniceicyclus]MBS2963479.1 class I SAM-dependent methyltransferase [Actinocrinis puniceicyclus]
MNEQLPATAYLTAVARAEATLDPACDLVDEYAARFAELCPPSVRAITAHTGGLSVVAARTTTIDAMLTRALERRAPGVFVNLGAGFDARPYRLDPGAWPPGCRVVEVDVASILDVKDRLLPPAEAAVPIERVRCDLRFLGDLDRALRPRTEGERLLLLAEGLLTYLPEPQLAGLARTLAGFGASASWICDALSTDSARVLTRASRGAGSKLTMYGLTDVRAFEENGWRCEDISLLPTARVQRSAGPGVGATSQLPDCVLSLRR